MAWKSIGNALAIIDVMGKFGIWNFVIPSSMKSPAEDIPMQSKINNGLLLFDEEDLDLCAIGSISDLDEDSDGESQLTSRKRLCEQPVSKENFDKDGNGEMALYPKRHSVQPRLRGLEMKIMFADPSNAIIVRFLSYVSENLSDATDLVWH
ncbi:hypothetical protein K1719_041881 [Acacia pycnantha]|nr:hypothetical protein K1719_041881 [Acacia pycnantha]